MLAHYAHFQIQLRAIRINASRHDYHRHAPLVSDLQPSCLQLI